MSDSKKRLLDARTRVAELKRALAEAELEAVLAKAEAELDPLPVDPLPVEPEPEPELPLAREREDNLRWNHSDLTAARRTAIRRAARVAVAKVGKKRLDALKRTGKYAQAVRSEEAKLLRKYREELKAVRNVSRRTEARLARPPDPEVRQGSPYRRWREDMDAPERFDDLPNVLEESGSLPDALWDAAIRNERQHEVDCDEWEEAQRLWPNRTGRTWALAPGLRALARRWRGLNEERKKRGEEPLPYPFDSYWDLLNPFGD